ncbi:hypothetical protein PC129_g21716 [Phytophthora cactorum]|uniref:RxLR effector protein n=1 Tax=Phytophthora cactorum TaxID=29920 RepID=A0A8T1JPL2_9STRA|nr:hypothetical protein Pcac1_g6842 [Phytophthora cactorum]KAG2794478.1 hypothetical protein PC112_g23027 [Phytophthora cactorum]KAG2795666.1 hypothetical protein PC111_g22055 [Phytophthora cactorum]KAG2822318.1 hypothetical protein PC113_g22351 [Phytophthora cactorum]KAG2876645.1 hypothetical protein PC115_g23565 [Phytophthora cactorum]
MRVCYVFLVGAAILFAGSTKVSEASELGETQFVKLEDVGW